VFLMYSPDGINIYGSKGGELGDRVGVAYAHVVESCKMGTGEQFCSLVQTLLL